jgi:hypothetical protein
VADGLDLGSFGLGEKIVAMNNSLITFAIEVGGGEENGRHVFNTCWQRLS